MAMKIIEIKPTKKFAGSWSAEEAPGVSPGTPDRRANSLQSTTRGIAGLVEPQARFAFMTRREKTFAEVIAGRHHGGPGAGFAREFCQGLLRHHSPSGDGHVKSLRVSDKFG
jgi:hypothetical protein